MAETERGERTEEATQQRRDEFRKRGQVAQTRELASVLVVFTGAVVIWVLGRFVAGQLVEVFTKMLGPMMADTVRQGDLLGVGKFVGLKLAMILAPVLGIFMVVSLGASIMQVGFLYNEEALSPNLDRLNPIEGFKRIVSLKALMEGLKALAKVTILSLIVFFILKRETEFVPYLMQYSVEQLLGYIGQSTVHLFTLICAFMAGLAGLDYFFQRWDLEQQMRMTKQELKEELRTREGDPMIKARIRRVQREMANKRMMEDVPKADVVVTNPTHLAVALQYSADLPAPKVVAKGANAIAEKIKEIAKKHRIPVVENKPLARTLFKTIKIGQVIPRELYNAVAEVLAFVFRLKGKKMKEAEREV